MFLLCIILAGGQMASRLQQRFHLVDFMTLSFVIANLVFILGSWRVIDHAVKLAAGYAACFFVTMLIISIGEPAGYPSALTHCARIRRWVQGLVREAYPLALFGYFFVAVTSFDTVINKTDLDPWFIAFENSVFGSVPSSWLMRRFDSFLLSELMHGAYVLYYVSIPGLAIWLYVKNRKALPEYIFISMLLFYITCLVYIVLPVVGGRYDPDTRTMTELYQYGPFTRLMAFIYRSSGHSGAAFPSTHVIMSLVMALISRRHAKKLAVVMIFNAILVAGATIYCGYHYILDLIGAIALTAILYPLGIHLYRRHGKVA